MNVVITGSNGTVGTILSEYLAEKKAVVIPWDRGLVPIDDYYAMEEFLRSSKPEVLFHLAIASRQTGRENESWVVNYEWTSELAWITRILNIKFIFTSTVMVFSDNNQGPFTLESIPDAVEGYGFEKRKAEERVFYQNPQATVVRLGWQIGEGPGSNNMIDYLEKQFEEKGKIRASRKWYPACSFLRDTVSVLWNLFEFDPGLYMIDSNRKWKYYEICCALKDLHEKEWPIVSTEDFVYDQRMIDTRLHVPSLKKRLPTLT